MGADVRRCGLNATSSIMSRLEDIQQDLRVAGVIPGETVRVLGVQHQGPDTIVVTYEAADGSLGRRVLGRDAEAAVSIEAAAARPLDADPQSYKLVAECQRIRLAGLADPLLGGTTSDTQPLPHQLRAVYGPLLEGRPLRFLLADDPGAGKTIM